MFANLLIGALLFASVLLRIDAFSGARRRIQRTHQQSSWLNLVPLSEVWDSSAGIQIVSKSKRESFSDLMPKLGCKSFDKEGALIASSNDAEGYKLYLATNIDDLPPITHLTLEVFDATAITLSSTSDWSVFEKAVVGAVVEPAISMYNSYANAVGYIEVLSGLRRRLSRVIAEGHENISINLTRWICERVAKHRETIYIRGNSSTIIFDSCFS